MRALSSTFAAAIALAACSSTPNGGAPSDAGTEIIDAANDGSIAADMGSDEDAGLEPDASGPADAESYTSQIWYAGRIGAENGVLGRELRPSGSSEIFDFGGEVQSFDVSADGMTIAVAVAMGLDRSDLVLARRNGVILRRVTMSGIAVRPRFSPDGSRVAFRWEQGSDRALHVARVTGGMPQSVSPPQMSTGTDFGVREWVWAPDSGSIAMIGVFEDRRLRSLTIANLFAQPGLELVVNRGDADTFNYPDALWGADDMVWTGRELFLSAVVAPSPTNHYLFRYDRSQRDVIAGVEAGELALSPDGTTLALVPAPGEAPCTMAENSTGPCDPIAFAAAMGALSLGLEWSPDSSTIAFVGRTSSSDPFSIWATRFGGNVTTRRLEFEERSGFAPEVSRIAWSPDGTELLALVRLDAGAGFELLRVRDVVDGTGFVALDQRVAATIDGQIDSFLWTR